MNLQLADGYVSAGHYCTITAKGTTVIAAGVTFEALVVDGSVTVAGCAGGIIDCRNGHVSCIGNLIVRDIKGYGDITVDGDLTCETVQLVGTVRVSGIMTCNRTVAVTGRLENSHIITARSVNLNGVLAGCDLRTDSLCIKPLCSRMLSRCAMNEYIDGSSARTVVGNTVHVHRLSCVTLHAKNVDLSERCLIRRLCNSTEFSSDGTAAVLTISADCSQSHLCQFKRA